MNWQQEALKRLDLLAEKLGTTGVYLWTVLVRQAISEGTADVAWALLFYAAVIVSIILAKRCYKLSLDNDDWTPCWIMLSAMSVVFLGFGAGMTVDAIQRFYNPGYYALKEVLAVVGK